MGSHPASRTASLLGLRKLFGGSLQLSAERWISMAIIVEKFDGRQEPFDRRKLLWSARHMGATEDVAEEAVRIVEKQAYNGITTLQLAHLLQRALQRFPTLARYAVNLRVALAQVNPYPDFEIFVRELLKRAGYRVQSGGVVRGLCTEHEIDGVLEAEGETLVLEVKHHEEYHTETNLDVVRIARALLEDLQEGAASGISPFSPTGVVIASNTKLSPQAAEYARCRKLRFLGWFTPPQENLNTLIQRHTCYPVTIINGLHPREYGVLSKAGIVVLEDLISRSLDDLHRLTHIPKDRLALLSARAKDILGFKLPQSPSPLLTR